MPESWVRRETGDGAAPVFPRGERGLDTPFDCSARTTQPRRPRLPDNGRCEIRCMYLATVSSATLEPLDFRLPAWFSALPRRLGREDSQLRGDLLAPTAGALNIHVGSLREGRRKSRHGGTSRLNSPTSCQGAERTSHAPARSPSRNP